MMKHIALLGVAVVLLCVLATAYGQSEAEPPLPSDSCVVRLDLPSKATVEVDGRDYGDQARTNLPKAPPGQDLLVPTRREVFW